ncbi:UvrD-helicase domain-containing protein [uncultured Anaerococcus sp.]|uniref:UvrD-helicase domain-containing protein n=1 Tax=uncultured Anaerococcus sp. TaxID=293428 RepID=UPI0025CDA3F6|nr:ATP-dependent helicase [uncultured Anaerococcus sp.]
MTEWEPKGVSSLEKEALSAIKDADDCLVEAGPGSGKTELLAQKLDYLFSTGKSLEPKKVLALSFKKDAAENLKIRVKQRYGNEFARRFISLTFAAFEKRILDQFLMSLPSDMRPNKDYIIVNKKFADGKAEVTYKDITKLSKLIIKRNVYIKRAIRLTYDFVFVDEFQDTTTEQYELLKECFLGSNTRLTAVGDKNQAIMRWADADEYIFEKFVIDFYPNKYRLLINYRSAEKLVEFQKYFLLKAFDLKQNVKVSNSEDAMDGNIRLIKFDCDTTEAERLAEDISNNIVAEVLPSEICILVKQKVQEYSNKIIEKLKTKGINSRIEDKYQDMLKNPLIALILDVILISENQKDPDAWENIKSYFFIPESTEDILSEGHSYNNYESEIELLIDNIRDIRKSYINCYDDMYKLILNIDSILEFNTVNYNYMKYSGAEEINKILKLFSELFYKEYINANKSWIDAVKNFKGENSIPIMTIHKSKGLEFEHVYLIGLEDNAFWSFHKDREENLNAIFVAISRAKNSFTFTYSQKRISINQSNNKINEIYNIIKDSGLVDEQFYQHDLL